ncbi:hypothetical protein KOW79_000423 [Hemibagrus wyckioides]|uniref:Apolipoprotein A-I n=2 Tax=Hemibagrus wyckioides TaxID=337641 RepID=A0A9D3P9U0_9TELE|nr:hypothetical protein KOW79_000423 [Hemibagrus wyckioides]
MSKSEATLTQEETGLRKHSAWNIYKERKTAKMKVFLMLALVAFTGCQARDPIDAIWYEMSKVTRPFDDVLAKFKETELGQKINAKMTEVGNAAVQYAETIQEHPLAQDIRTKIIKEAEVLRKRFVQDLTNVRDKLEPFAENLKTQIEQKVEELRTVVTPYTESYDSDALKTTVLQKTEELRVSLEEKVKELQSKIDPFTDELKQKVDQHVQEFQKAVAPLNEDLQAKVAEIQQGLAPYAEILDPYVKALNDRLTSLHEIFVNTFN